MPELKLDLPLSLHDNHRSMRILPAIATLIICLLTTGCSKENLDKIYRNQPGEVDSLPIENSKLKNCRFQSITPSYAYGTAITPNPIICEEGVAKKVEILTPNPLPSGIQFSQDQLSLIGTANERVIQAPYEFYLENESGYTIIKIQISIQ